MQIYIQVKRDKKHGGWLVTDVCNSESAIVPRRDSVIIAVEHGAGMKTIVQMAEDEWNRKRGEGNGGTMG